MDIEKLNEYNSKGILKHLLLMGLLDPSIFRNIDLINKYNSLHAIKKKSEKINFLSDYFNISKRQTRRIIDKFISFQKSKLGY